MTATSSTQFFNIPKVRAHSQLATCNSKVVERPRFRQSYHYIHIILTPRISIHSRATTLHCCIKPGILLPVLKYTCTPISLYWLLCIANLKLYCLDKLYYPKQVYLENSMLLLSSCIATEAVFPVSGYYCIAAMKLCCISFIKLYCLYRAVLPRESCVSLSSCTGYCCTATVKLYCHCKAVLPL